jgi:hypothetical protein
MNMTKLFLDFDGVVNFDGSRSAYTKRSNELNLAGYLRRNSAVSRGRVYNLNYSDEVVTKLNRMKAAHNFSLRWLSTWVDDTAGLDVTLGLNSNGYVPWDPYTDVTYDNLFEVRASRKYAALKADYDGEPFVWVDDEATVKFVPSDFDVPYLVLAPDPRYGLTRDHLDEMYDFFAANGGAS